MNCDDAPSAGFGTGALRSRTARPQLDGAVEVVDFELAGELIVERSNRLGNRARATERVFANVELSDRVLARIARARP